MTRDTPMSVQLALAVLRSDESIARYKLRRDRPVNTDCLHQAHEKLMEECRATGRVYGHILELNE